MARERNTQTISSQELEARFAKLTLAARKPTQFSNLAIRTKQSGNPGAPAKKPRHSQKVTMERRIFYLGKTQAILQLTEQQLPEIRIEGSEDWILWESDIEAMLEHALEDT
ncbi:hypothetical protein PG996_011243 [Apiospora saccharicola]|uniref:Uncharacterized protein n=1 Tax=Apiospora saccharicola TaxID=335842 RepID=A0ABR1UGR3_9PEZI